MHMDRSLSKDFFNTTWIIVNFWNDGGKKNPYQETIIINVMSGGFFLHTKIPRFQTLGPISQGLMLEVALWVRLVRVNARVFDATLCLPAGVRASLMAWWSHEVIARARPALSYRSF